MSNHNSRFTSGLPNDFRISDDENSKMYSAELDPESVEAYQKNYKI